MKFGFIVVALPFMAHFACAQQHGFKSLKWDPVKREGRLEVFDPNRPTDRYPLGPLNRTANIWTAYQVDSIVVILGEMDGDIGEIVTAIDARSKRELMEFLCYDAQPSESGLRIAFRHFYPHFGTADLSDRVQVIDLSQGVPPLVPSADFHVPPEDAGRTVYPQTPVETGLRHRVQEFVWGSGESSLFFVERVEGVVPGNVEQQDLCLVRVDQVTSSSPRAVHSCLNPRELGVDSITSIWPKRFHRDAAGELLLSLELVGAPIESSSRDYKVDPVTLKLSPAKRLDTESYMTIPWAVQKKQLITFTPVRSLDALKSYERDVVGVKLIIGIDGTVDRAELSDSLPEDVRHELAGVISQWRFRPTILDGKRTRVLTNFEARLGDLEDPGWASLDQ